MIAQPACVVCGGNKVAAQSVHFGQRAYHTGVTEVINVFAAGKAGAGSRFYGDDFVISFAAQFFTHKRRNQTAQIGAAAGASDDHIRYNVVFVHSCFGFKADNGLVQQNLI